MGVEKIQFNRIPGYVFASLCVSMGGLINGYDTGTVGAVSLMPQFSDIIGELSPMIRGLTVSIIMLASAISSTVAGVLAHHFGHLAVIGMGACIFTVGVIFEGAAYHLAVFIAGRVLAGTGQGLWLGIANIYICEISPCSKRGKLSAIPQLLNTVGIFLGYFTCYGSVKLQSSMSWRMAYIIQGMMGIALATTCLYLPKSPRWLVQKNERILAVLAVKRLGISIDEAEASILSTGDSGSETSSASDEKPITGLLHRRHRSRTFLGFFILTMLGMCGIDGVLYYAPVLFGQAGLSQQTSSFLASGVSAILNMLVSIPAVLLADRWGRRTSMLVGGILLSACMLTIGALYASNTVGTHGDGRWVVIILIYVYSLSYSATWAISAKLYAGEIQATETRARVIGAAQGLNFLANWIVALTTPIFLAKSPYGPYFLYGVSSLFATVILVLYMAETRGLSLEHIQSRTRSL